MTAINRFHITLKHDAKNNYDILKSIYIGKIPMVNFNALIPIPENIGSIEKEFDFCLKNWGTQYQALPPRKRKNLKNNEFNFISVENFPINWLLSLSKKFEDINWKAIVKHEIYTESGDLRVENLLYEIKNENFSVKIK